MRYVCVTFTLTLTMISPKVKKRFPTLNHLVEAGLMTHEEKNIMEQIDNDFPPYSKYWYVSNYVCKLHRKIWYNFRLPLAWAASIATRARHEGEITSDLGVKGILDELNGFRSNCGRLLDYDWISIPLVYTQVFTVISLIIIVIFIIHW